LAADDDDSNGDVFIVVKLDYSATSGSVTDGYADVSIFIDPDLGSSEPTTPALTGSTYTAFNGLLIVSNAPIDAETTSSIDEIRFGTTFADVAPIAGGGEPADLNTDGFVDGLDLGVLLGNWDTDTTAENGELNGTTPVDGLDLGILLGAWNPPASTVGAVPEPTTLALLSIASVLGCLRRRK
jgi:hypothetical protein